MEAEVAGSEQAMVTKAQEKKDTEARVGVLEKQVSELEAARGALTGPSPYSVLYDMAKCMNQMGKEVEKVKLFLRCGVAALLNPIRRPCRSTNRGGRSRTT